MQVAKFKLTGFPAVIALLFVIGMVVAHFFYVKRSLDPTTEQMLKGELTGEYMTQAMAGLNAAQMTAEQGERLAQASEAAGDIQFTSIAIRGLTQSRVLKLGILVGGNPPPDGKSVRYYLLSCERGRRCRVRFETTERRYRIGF